MLDAHPSAGSFSDFLAAAPDCIKILDLEGRLKAVSANGRRLLGIDDFAPFANADWLGFWQARDRTAAAQAMQEARSGREGRFIDFFRTLRRIASVGIATRDRQEQRVVVPASPSD